MSPVHELAAALLLLCGLGTVLGLAAAPVDMVADNTAPAASRDGAVLAACMNGQRIVVDEGYVMTCNIRKARM